MHYVSDTARYPSIVFVGLYLILAYIERLISTVWCFFNYFGVSINCMSWVGELHNIFLTCAETEAISMFEAFSIIIYENPIQTIYLVSNFSNLICKI